nr:ribonuclease H-like domain-containing protein [Tanacetum cinerariifolium]
MTLVNLISLPLSVYYATFEELWILDFTCTLLLPSLLLGTQIRIGQAAPQQDGLLQGSQVAYLIIYVDDIIITASSTYLLQLQTGPETGPEGVPVHDPTLYRSLAGGLQYLTFSRPDISYAVQQICIYMHDPREPHLAALKRILCYIRRIIDFGFYLYSSTTISLVGYTDTDWAGCPSTRWSTSDHPDIEPERMFVENKFYLDNINDVSVEELLVNSLTNDGCLCRS